MATVPTEVTAVAGTVLTAATWNSNVRDAINFLLAPPTVELTQAVAQAIPQSGAILTFDTEIVDTDGMHSTVTNTSRVTVQTPGRYAIGGAASFVGNSTGVRGTWWMVNGTSLVASEVIGAPTSLNQVEAQARYRQPYFNAGDYLELMAYHNVAGSLNTSVAFAPQQPSLSARWCGNT